MHDNILRGDSLLGEQTIDVSELIRLMNDEDHPPKIPFVKEYDFGEKMTLSISFVWRATA